MPRHTICINCLMMKAKARRLYESDGVWECNTVGGCASRFTDNFLDSCYPSVARLMNALGFEMESQDKKKKDSAVIEKGSIAERREQAAITGERSVILPDEDDV